MKSNDAACITLVSIAHALSHFMQIALPPLFPFIREELGVSYSALGFIVMLPFLASAALQPFAGMLVDRIGGRAVLVGGVAILSVGVLLMAFAEGTFMLAFGALVMGVGNSVFHPADLAILNGRVAIARLGYAFSAHSVAGSLGFAVGPLFSAAIASVYGWQSALLAAAGVGFAYLIVLLANSHQIHVPGAPRKSAGAADARVLRSPAVLLCFAFMLLWGCGSAGMQSFSMTALQLQYGVDALLASAAFTAYMIGNAVGMLVGGVVAVRARRHTLVAGAGLSAAALVLLLIAMGAVPAAALSAALFAAGAASGVTFPVRDLLVRGAAPQGSTGKVYGFVYSGMDLGSLLTPVFYGMLLDNGMPQGVFYAICIFTIVSMLTVLQLPGRKLAIQRT